MVDEVEKALAGVASSGSTDSGVTARLFGMFLTWLNDRTSDSYVICTCNEFPSSRLSSAAACGLTASGSWTCPVGNRRRHLGHLSEDVRVGRGSGSAQG